MQLVKGAVEEVKLKGHDLCLKLTSTVNGEKQIHLSFTDAKLYSRWLRRCKKVTLSLMNRLRLQLTVAFHCVLGIDIVVGV